MKTSNLRNQEFSPLVFNQTDFSAFNNSSDYDSADYGLYNSTDFGTFNSSDYVNGINLTSSSSSIVNNDLYPKNTILFNLYSISAIWYCLFSLLFNLILGSLFSLIYSLIKSQSIDADKSFDTERKKYLFKAEYFNFKK